MSRLAGFSLSLAQMSRFQEHCQHHYHDRACLSREYGSCQELLPSQTFRLSLQVLVRSRWVSYLLVVRY